MAEDLIWQDSKGFTDYDYAADYMEKYVKDIVEDKCKEKIWLVEHDHIYTMGVSAKESDIIDKSDVPFVATKRGGKITYHGPGMRIIYVMLNLKTAKSGCDIRKFINLLESWMIAVLAHYGIKAFIREDRVGIWVNHNGLESKIGAIGIRLKKWVSYHGIAINIDPDLSKYANIVPCGISSDQYGVTSLKDLGVETSFNEFDKILKQEFFKQFY
jgi:lipoyl(octanoyl) transferase